MPHTNKTYQIGDVTITKIEEMRLNVAQPSFLFPDWDADELDRNLHWLTPSNMDAATGNLIQSIHTWLVRTKHHTILVDTGSGNNKERPRNTIFHRLQTPYLQRLAAAGVKPEDVDYVLHTHLHVDHVGWNTRLVDGRWIPTFPNARHVFSHAEEDYYSSPASHNDVNVPSLGVYEDSVAPIIASGQADRISNAGGEYLDNFIFRPSKGHSIGHMSIELRSKGTAALFSGDVMHHPLQVIRPDWNSVFCEWQDEARASRRWALEYAAERQLLFFTPHFAESSAGYVTRRGDHFAWRYE
ncbi:MBL fold metallo-hydrolase [Bordetella genomosp. 4]|uniref:MBL fold metallo-hydrolase n=1 Tax=Bordetella genomosp. 4 TaxID=463044 RepID=A0A261UUH4_9BORD|nr:MBL fold metallo-hydrolase [Bordetella genomosp. 4]OZI64553.1 MBL fold metallo-hydrolase [Bordetella genomosp. 4]